MEITEIYSTIDSLPQSKQIELVDFINKLLLKVSTPVELIKPVFGCAKGMIYISPDFDEPLEEFAEYML